jgi:hypothetical protein
MASAGIRAQARDPPTHPLLRLGCSLNMLARAKIFDILELCGR